MKYWLIGVTAALSLMAMAPVGSAPAAASGTTTAAQTGK
jgi:hypothetical protein